MFKTTPTIIINNGVGGIIVEQIPSVLRDLLLLPPLLHLAIDPIPSILRVRAHRRRARHRRVVVAVLVVAVLVLQARFRRRVRPRAHRRRRRVRPRREGRRRRPPRRRAYSVVGPIATRVVVLARVRRVRVRRPLLGGVPIVVARLLDEVVVVVVVAVAVRRGRSRRVVGDPVHRRDIREFSGVRPYPYFVCYYNLFFRDAPPPDRKRD